MQRRGLDESVDFTDSATKVQRVIPEPAQLVPISEFVVP
jgi:hypothetical protein